MHSIQENGMKIIVAGGGLLLNEKNELLMIFRRGAWDLPKGKLDAGEIIEACALREVEEETGVGQLILGDLLGITRHQYFDTFLKEEVIKETHWFAMKVSGCPSLIPQKEEDITDIRWVPLPDVPALLENSFDTIREITGLFFSKLPRLTD